MQSKDSLERSSNHDGNGGNQGSEGNEGSSSAGTSTGGVLLDVIHRASISAASGSRLTPSNESTHGKREDQDDQESLCGVHL